MHINWWTLALQAINVLVLIWLLSRFLYRPVVAAVAARQAAADKLLADASAAKEQAKSEEAALKSQTEALTADSDRLRAEVRTAAEADRERLLDAARQDAAKVAEYAKVEIATERAAMTKELERQSATLAGDMAAKLVQRLPPPFVQQAMARALVDRVSAMPEPERAALLGGGPFTIVTASPLEEAGRVQCREALGAATEIEFREDPTLLGGCELNGAHVDIRNSWRADLDDMLGQMMKDGDDVGGT